MWKTCHRTARRAH